MNKYDQLFNEKLGEALKEIPFNFYSYSPLFVRDIITKCLPYHTTDSLQISIAEYARFIAWLYDNEAIATMPTMHNCFTAFANITPHQMSISCSFYLEVKEVFEAMQKTWDEIAKPHIEAVQKEVAEIAKRDTREAEAKNKIRGKNGKIISLT